MRLPETVLYLVLMAPLRAVTTKTRAEAIRATVRAYSTIVAPSSLAIRFLVKRIIDDESLLLCSIQN